MSLTPAQLAQMCPACQTAGRRGYCAPNACYCGHDECPAYASFVPRRPRSLPENVHPFIPWKEAS